MATETEFRLEVSFGDASFAAEGSVKQVMDAYAVFRQDAVGEQPPSVAPKADPPKPSGKAKAEKQNPQGGRTPLPVFLQSHPPKNNAEAVAVLATWATEHGGEAEITTKLIQKLFRQSGRKMPKNLSRDIGTAETNGWLDKDGRGKYTLPQYGADHAHGIVPAAK
jgi:hypothetical protein